MIRRSTAVDESSLIQLWFETNVSAHRFIDPAYWQNNRELVRSSLGEAVIYVYENEKKICGFIGLMGNYVAGLFVDSSCQSGGIGQALLDHVKKEQAELYLHVFTKNNGAFRFYVREGFVPLKEQIDEPTGEAETLMQWRRLVS